MSVPRNNPLKLPFLILCAVIGLVVAVINAIYGAWLLAIFGLAITGVSLAIARVIKQGRNPRWFRSPLDGRWPRSPK